MYIIYKFTSPSKRNYIGLTKNEPVRLSAHRQKEYSDKDQTYFARAIRKYGFESFHYSIIDKAETLEEASAKEIHYIQFYDSVNSGYNILLGGSNAPKYQHEGRLIEDVAYLLKTTNKSQKIIAKECGVSESLVCEIKNGRGRGVEVIIRPNHQSQKGSSNKLSKLSEDQAKEIREKLQAGATRRQMQQEYGVSKTLIQLIATNQSWSHVEANYEYKKKQVNGNAVLNVDVVSKLKADIKTGTFTRAELAKKYGISIQTVDQIKAGKTWKHVS